MGTVVSGVLPVGGSGEIAQRDLHILAEFQSFIGLGW